jgi:type IV pilus assembly protein PilM
MDSVSVGLDIGSTGVRAAEVSVGQGRRVLRRYAQVGLPHGYVVDGEIVNIPGVSAALRRLWEQAGFTTTNVVLGVSGPRVFVRQADVPALSTEEMRSSLKFDAQELIPIPMEDACFDFSVLEQIPGGGKDGRDAARILIVAAHREVLRSHLAALKGAGLSAKTIDAAPLSLLRAVPPRPAEPGHTGYEVLVSIGAELTTVAVRQAGVPRFIRSLTVGGADITESVANSMHLELAAAERLKRGAVPSDLPQLPQARKAISVELRDLAEDVRATVDFFTGQSDGTTIDRLLVTGGASLTEGLTAAIGGNLPVTVERVDPFSTLSIGELDLGPDALERAASNAANAIGLALWNVDAPLIRLSILPDEVMAARRARRMMTAAACGVAGLTALLGVAGLAQVMSVHSAQHKVELVQGHVASLTTQVARLQAATQVHGEVAARAQLEITALQGDIDWVRLLGQLATVMPPSLSLQSFSGTRTVAPPVTPPASSTSKSTTAGSTSTPPASTAGSASTGVGTLSFSVDGTGGLPAVAAWLDGLQRDQSLQGTWVSGISVTANGGKVTFTSTSEITPVAQSGRAEEVQP